MDFIRRHGAGHWAVAFALLTVLAFCTVPTPLYAIYQTRDGFSTFMITVVFAAYAVGVLVALFFAGHLSDRVGRRRALVPAVLLALLSAGVFLIWRELPGLLVGRVLSGLSVGVVTSTATAYLAELRPQRAQVLATTANLGGLGLGAFASGLLAEFVAAPLTVPYVVFAVLLAVAALAVAATRETVTPPNPLPPYRPQRIAVPAEARGRFAAAAAGAFVSFAAFGLFTSLAPTFLAGTLGHSSHALAGLPAFVAFGAAVVAQLASGTMPVPRLLVTATALLSAGLSLVVTATWLESLGLFLAGGAIAGAGAGLLFKGGIATVSALASPERRAEVLAGFFLAGYLGISVPVLGLGVLDQFVEPKLALLAFAGLLVSGLAASARSLLASSARALPQPAR